MVQYLYPLYKSLSYAVLPLAYLYLKWRTSKGKEVKVRLSERFGYSPKIRPKGKVIWFHVASLGEGLSALPLINKFVNEKDINVLLTYGTVTASQILPSRLPKKVLHSFVPFDLPCWVRRFLRHWQPDIGIMLESEIWPALLKESQAENIPLILINGRMSENSYKRWLCVKPLMKDLLSAVNLGLMQDQIMADRYNKLGLSTTKVLGNIKMVSDPLPVNPDLYKKLREKCKERPVWVAASTHVHEEDLILEAHIKLCKLYPNLLTIIVPRKLDLIDGLYLKLREQQLSFVSHARSTNLTDESIYVADVMGEMGTFLSLSSVVYVGGSQFKPHGKSLGGHNPLEPALHKKALCFGPDMANAHVVAEGLIASGAAEIVETPNMLVEYIDDLIKDPELCAAKGERAFAYAQSRKNILQEAITSILNVIQENPKPDVITSQVNNKVISLYRPAFWETDSLLSKILYPISFVYQHMSNFYQAQQKTRKYSVPVICVGNINVGGTGKTPTIKAFAEYLVSQNYTPHIVSKGYGRKRNDTLLVTSKRTVADVGDEPILLSKSCPTWVGDRHIAIEKAISSGASHILLDDGFQDASLVKDFSVLVIDGHYGFGNGKVMPAGPLREDIGQGLKRADASLIIGEDRTALSGRVEKENIINLKAKFVPLKKVPEGEYLAFAGIGSPEKFFESLSDAGVNVVVKMPLPDHVSYDDALIKKIQDTAKDLSLRLITTEKDATKMKGFTDSFEVFEVKLKGVDFSFMEGLTKEKAV